MSKLYFFLPRGKNLHVVGIIIPHKYFVWIMDRIFKVAFNVGYVRLDRC